MMTLVFASFLKYHIKIRLLGSILGASMCCEYLQPYVLCYGFLHTRFIRVREMSGKFKFFQGQGIVREFYVVSVKNGYLLKCQGNVREFYNFQFVPNDEK